MTSKPLTLAIGLVISTASLSIHAQNTEQACMSQIEHARAACSEAAEALTCIEQNIDKSCRALFKNNEEFSRTLDQTTVIGTRFGIDVDKYPGSASVISADELQKSTDIIRSLSNIPGIETGLDNGRSIGQQYSIRGFGYSGESRVIVMQDGVRRSTNLFSNHVSSFRTDADLVKQVDVVRGSSSISHGGGAIGGVIGTTTKDPEDFIVPGNEFGVTTNFRYDSNNQKQGYAAFAFSPFDARWDLLVFGKQSNKGDLKLAEEVSFSDGSTNDTVDNDEDMATYFIKGGIDIADGQRIILSHYVFENDTEVTWQTLYHQETSPRLGPVVGHMEQNDTVLRYVANPSNNRWLDLSLTAYMTEAYYDRGYNYIPTNPTPRDAPLVIDYKNIDERKGVQLQNLMRFSTGNINHRLLLGMDYEHREEDASYVRNGTVSDFGSMPNSYKDLGFFVQHEASMFDNRFVLQLGGRYDSFQREVKGKSKYDNSRFSPRIGASFEVMDGFNLLANYSEAFRAPTPHETSSEGSLNPHYWYLPNPDLGPETSAEYEAGFSWRQRGLLADDDEIRIKTMYFMGEIDDLIELVPDYDGPTPPPDTSTYYATYRNVDTVNRYGLELESAYHANNYSLFLTYERLDQTSAEDGKRVPSAFANKARLAVELHPFDEDFSVGFDVNHWFRPKQNPESFVSRGRTYYRINKPYSLSNMYLRWRPYMSGISSLDDRFEVMAGVNNIFDRKRLHPANIVGSSRVGVGRNIYVSLTKKF